MAKQVYTYSSFPIAPSESHPRGFSAQRPLIYATVTASNGEAFDWAVLLDSGADNCLFPLRLASYLNLDVTAMPRTLTGGVGSKANVTYFDHLRIGLGRGIAFTAYVGFTEGMDAMAIGLLGQDGSSISTTWIFEMRKGSSRWRVWRPLHEDSVEKTARVTLEGEGM